MDLVHIAVAQVENKKKQLLKYFLIFDVYLLFWNYLLLLLLFWKRSYELQQHGFIFALMLKMFLLFMGCCWFVLM